MKNLSGFLIAALLAFASPAFAQIHVENPWSRATPPGAKIGAGYDDMMPPSPLEEREIQGIIAYMQSLKEGT